MSTPGEGGTWAAACVESLSRQLEGAQGPSDSGPHFPEFLRLCGCLERWWGSSSYKLNDHQHV